MTDSTRITDDEDMSWARLLLAGDLEAKDAEIEQLRRDCRELYQVVGYLAHHAKLFNDPQTVKALDNACAAAEGKPRPHADLLPFTANVRDEADANPSVHP